MQMHFLETSKSPRVTLTVNGQLTVKGWDQSRVQIRSYSEQDFDIDQQDDDISIRCNESCALNVPFQTSLSLETVNGQASFKALKGELVSDEINGNIDLRSVGPVILRKVEGNISARDVDGDLEIDKANGNLTVRDIQGRLVVKDRITGNLNLYDADGDATASADGNINLRLDPSPGNRYALKANGNIVCRLSQDVSAKVSIESANKITINLPRDREDLEEEVLDQHPEAPYNLTLGDGDAQIKLSASGNVILSSVAPEWDFVEDIDFDIDDEINELGESISEQVEQQLESQMEMLEQQLEIQMEMLSARLGKIGIGDDEARRIEERSRQAAERATQRAQDKIRRAQERLEQKLAAAQRKAEQKARIAARKSRAQRSRSFSINIPARPMPPAEEQVSDEERLIILRMLEEKKISPEEAEQLLQALEGKEA